jgi:hypothetical protein
VIERLAVLPAEKKETRIWRDGERRFGQAVIFQIHGLPLTKSKIQGSLEISRLFLAGHFANQFTSKAHHAFGPEIISRRWIKEGQ